MKNILVLALLLALVYSQDQCSMPDYEKSDCGYVGVDQDGCQSKGCCWVPAGEGSSTPWCFYKQSANPCGIPNFTATSQPFTEDNYNTMYNYFMANIDIQGKGGVLASPDTDVFQGGSYYYAWVRDGALTMRTFMEINDMDLSKIDAHMQSYTNWVNHVHSQTDPNDVDIRGEVKYNLPNGDPYTGGWCRPQNDGPALRALSLIMYAQVLLKNNKNDYVTQNLWTGNDSDQHGGPIKYDLDYVVDNWNNPTCDLWEEIRVNDLFWNRFTTRHALLVGADFAKAQGDNTSAQKYTEAAAAITEAIGGSWNGEFVQESSSRQIDAAVIGAFNEGYHGDDLYAPLDAKIAKTIAVYNNNFCNEYKANQNDDSNKIPGIMYGRYKGDHYGGGNPWVLSTSYLADLFYRGALYAKSQGDKFALSDDQIAAWKSVLSGLEDKPTLDSFVKAMTSAGDSVLTRLYHHVSQDGFHLAEQIDRNTGAQCSATDLTWSYATTLKAYKRRQQLTSDIEKLETRFLAE